jgi:hypothetical protein
MLWAIGECGPGPLSTLQPSQTALTCTICSLRAVRLPSTPGFLFWESIKGLMSTSTRGLHHLSAVDFNLHDLVGIRLLNADSRDASAVARQLGPIQKPLTDEPDITIRFVEALEIGSRMRYLGVDEAGFTDDTFLVLRSKHKAQARVQIPFGQIGQPCEIICEAGLPAVPLLIPIINLTVLAKGALPLHASAFNYGHAGILTTGWSKGGKTEALLAFMEHGATYIGDEWVYISADGQRIYGIPEPVRIWDWYLGQLPRYLAHVGRGDRLRLGTIKLVAALERLTPGFPLKQALSRVARALKQQLYVDLRPQDLFPPDAFALSGALDKVFFVASHNAPRVVIEPVDPLDVAERVVFSLQYERLPFMAYYMMYRFAFPHARNEWIENAEELQRQVLTRVLADKEAHIVYHPYPAVLSDLFEAMQPYITRQGVKEAV